MISGFTTCMVCGEAVHFTQSGFAEPFIFEHHECPPEPNLSTMKHISYEPVPQHAPQKVNDVENR